jgi:hypothetical protein
MAASLARAAYSMTDPAMGSVADAARIAAAEALTRAGRSADAAMVRSGRADDFPEVQAAQFALTDLSARTARLERALRCYADETFWEAHLNSEPLAVHDNGDIARAALLGKESFQQHRD